MDVVDPLLCALIWQREINFSINSSWSDQSRIKIFHPVRCQNYFYIAAAVEAIELVQQLQQCSLDLFFSSGMACISFSSDCVDFIDKNDAGGMLFCHFKQLSHQLRPVS